MIVVKRSVSRTCHISVIFFVVQHLEVALEVALTEAIRKHWLEFVSQQQQHHHQQHYTTLIECSPPSLEEVPYDDRAEY